MIKSPTPEQIEKVEDALKLPFDRYSTLEELEDLVVIFKDGEVHNGGAAMLVYEPDNELLDLFPEDEGYEKILF